MALLLRLDGQPVKRSSCVVMMTRAPGRTVLDLDEFRGLEPNSTTRTPATNTTNGQKFATSQHLDVSRCWALALRCGKFVVELL